MASAAPCTGRLMAGRDARMRQPHSSSPISTRVIPIRRNSIGTVTRAAAYLSRKPTPKNRISRRTLATRLPPNSHSFRCTSQAGGGDGSYGGGASASVALAVISLRGMLTGTGAFAEAGPGAGLAMGALTISGGGAGADAGGVIAAVAGFASASLRAAGGGDFTPRGGSGLAAGGARRRCNSYRLFFWLRFRASRPLFAPSTRKNSTIGPTTKNSSTSTKNDCICNSPCLFARIIAYAPRGPGNDQRRPKAPLI